MRAGGTGPGSEPPLLDRPTRLEYECSQGGPVSRLGLAPWLPGVLAENATHAFLLRAQGCNGELSVDVDHCEDGAAQLVLSGIDSTGTLGEFQLLAASARSFDLLAHPGGLAAFWHEVSPEHGLFFAGFDDEGRGMHERRAVVNGEGASQPKLALSKGGYAAFFVDGSTGDDSIRVAFLDENGAVVGSPMIVRESGALLELGAVAALPDGYALTYSTYDDDGTRSYLTFVDADGAPDGESILLGGLAEYPIFTDPTQSLLVRDDELIVAFSRQSGSYENEDLATTVQLAKVNLTSRPTTITALSLQGPIQDEENTQPALIGIGHDVGVAWSRGSVVYLCSGCTPDNHFEFVILDGEDLTPLGEPVRLDNPFSVGGMILPDIARQGQTLLVTGTLQYHLLGEGVFGSIDCQAAD